MNARDKKEFELSSAFDKIISHGPLNSHYALCYLNGYLCAHVKNTGQISADVLLRALTKAAVDIPGKFKE